MNMGRTPSCEKTGLKKGPWTDEEDQKLIDHIQTHGPGNWRALPKKAGLQRCGKSCRLRWTNYLRPDIKRGGFSVEEEEYIIELHSVMGNKWSAIAAKLPGRTDNEIKNYWNTHIRKKLLQMGIDPVTHGPRLDLLDLPSILSSLHHSSLIKNPALLNLQTLLNPYFLKLATSLKSSQNDLSYILPNNSFVGNTLAQNKVHQIETRVQNRSSFVMRPNLTEDLSNLCRTEQICQENNHVNIEFNIQDRVPVSEKPSLDESDTGIRFPTRQSNPSLSNIGPSSNWHGSNHGPLLSPCTSPVDPIDASLMYLNSSPNSEDDEVDYFFSNILKKLENPALFNVGTS